MDHFKLHSEFQPTGDQPQAIEELVEGFREGNQFETLLGVTGSGKTFTMANVIEKLNKPTLVLAHNKTLAAQLYGEMKEFFPENAVEYFVSYYDYYQPEAYVPSSDTYIAKDSAINDEIDRITEIDTLTGEIRKGLEFIAVFPASHYVVPMDKILRAANAIEEELAERRKTWVCPPPRIQSGYLKRYARSVSSADRGAILL